MSHTWHCVDVQRLQVLQGWYPLANQPDMKTSALLSWLKQIDMKAPIINGSVWLELPSPSPFLSLQGPRPHPPLPLPHETGNPLHSITPPCLLSQAVHRFKGGETEALARLKYYLWDTDLVATYFQTRNGMLGGDYSTKFSPWLAHGCLSSRTIYHEIKKYEAERKANKSTYWVVFELLWRDYFRWGCALFCGCALMIVPDLQRGRDKGYGKLVLSTLQTQKLC